MAKALNKFSTAYDKMKPELKKYSSAELKVLGIDLTAVMNNLQAAQEIVKEGIAKARKAGVSGVNIADYKKNKDFKETLEEYELGVKKLADTVADYKTFSDGAKDQIDKLEKLTGDIDKDLKSRKDKSESKDEIIALRAELQTKIKSLGDAAKLYSGLTPNQISYDIT